MVNRSFLGKDLMAPIAANVCSNSSGRFSKPGMEEGLVSPVDEGPLQSGPLSPPLSNLVLDEPDNELSRRGHRFCRYADDCVPRKH
jgi:retron-type reverse transcriptase